MVGTLSGIFANGVRNLGHFFLIFGERQREAGGPHHGVELCHRFIEGAIIKSPTFDRGQGWKRLERRFRFDRDDIVAWPSATTAGIGPIGRSHGIADRPQTRRHDDRT